MPNENIFERIEKQFHSLYEKDFRPECIYLSQELADEFKEEARIHLHSIRTAPTPRTFAEYCDVPVRRVVDCLPDYLHVTGKRRKMEEIDYSKDGGAAYG